jgi:Winged helix-turn helix
MNHSPRNWKEARRLQAWKLLQQGWSQRQIAEAMGVSEGAVSQWMQRARAGGHDALRHRASPGAPRRLAADQLAGRVHYVLLTGRPLEDSTVGGWPEKILDQPTCGGVPHGRGSRYLR